jgi:hypothetical protein
MATVGTVVTKQTIIDDFVSAVMAPEQTRGRWHLYSKPTYDYAIGLDDATNYVGPYPIIQDVLVDPSVGMANPTAANFTEAIAASNIVSVLRDYAYGTTRVRLARAGIFYNYHIGGSSGTFGEQVAYAHLNDTYLRTNPLSVSGPAANDIITADALNTFYTSLRLAANTDTYGDIIDLRICHTSCHANCHGSRGRR